MHQNAFSRLPTFDSTDPYRREDQSLPKLTEGQVELIREFGEQLDFPAGKVLFSRGDRGVGFYLVIAGSIEIIDTSECGKEQVVATLRDRQFSGELHLFNDRKVLVGGRTGLPTRLLWVKRQDFRRMLTAEPELAEIILRAFMLRRMGFILHDQGGVTLIGYEKDPDTLRIRQFLTGNGYPYRMVAPDAQTETQQDMLTALSLSLSDLPAVWDSKDHILKNPSTERLAAELGLIEEIPEGQIYDVTIVGAGPAGLAASVYAASEGLETLVIEVQAPGGQAGTSSRIENYLGFPNGISGQELAGRAQVQAQKFGAHLAVAREVTSIHRDEWGHLQITLNDGTHIRTRSVVVATGAQYRKLAIAGYERFEGRGIHYAATAMESQFCRGEEIIVVGGGNSAGQAAVYLSKIASKVHMLVRSKALASSMSSYLIDRIHASPHIQLYYESEITSLEGRSSLEKVEWTSNTSDQLWSRPVRNVFVMIGAVPNTQWLRGCMSLDPKGFVRTGKAKDGSPLGSPYETVERGIFAVGDVRADSVKRVASAVGEGSVVIQWVHYLLESERAENLQKKAA